MSAGDLAQEAVGAQERQLASHGGRALPFLLSAALTRIEQAAQVAIAQTGQSKFSATDCLDQSSVFRRPRIDVSQGASAERGQAQTGQRRLPPLSGVSAKALRFLAPHSGRMARRRPDAGFRALPAPAWVSWVILNADKDPAIRVFRQTPRHGEKTWALWLVEQNYVVILAERSGYYLLKTAFLVTKEHKREELDRDWQASQDLQKS
jgi:hypothetical protein